VLRLATPYRGRAIPCGLITYSSKTLAARLDSRNRNHLRALGEMKAFLGERPLVLDREFSDLGLLLRLVEEQVHGRIRLNLGSHPPKFRDAEGKEVALTLSPEGTVVYRQVGYKGQVGVTLIGTWERGLAEPMWIMTNLEVQEGLRIYHARMKIEETFRDLKSLLGMTRLEPSGSRPWKRCWLCCCWSLPEPC